MGSALLKLPFSETGPSVQTLDKQLYFCGDPLTRVPHPYRKWRLHVILIHLHEHLR